MKSIIDENGIWVIDEDTHFRLWIKEARRLDHDVYVLERILPYIPVNGVVIDGGAFIGDHTKAYVDKVGPKGVVYAFETNPVAYECLIKNCPTALPYDKGLSDKAEKLYFHKEKGNIGASYISADKSRVQIATMRIDTLSLDKLDFIKLDVRGYEYRALMGAKKSIEKFKPVLYIEVNGGTLANVGNYVEDIFLFLQLNNYKYKVITGEINAPQYDILCWSNND